MTGLVCDVCGSAATVQTQDVKPGEPVKDADGNLWATWLPVQMHTYCDKHWEQPTGGPIPPPGAVTYWLSLGDMWMRHRRANEDGKV
jgi:hypothetical protein